MPSMARIDPFASPSRTLSTQMESLFLDSSPDFGPVQCTVQKVCESKVNGCIVTISGGRPIALNTRITTDIPRFLRSEQLEI